MDIIKKNLLSIICGVVAIAALVTVFLWPLDGYFEDLKQRADKRAQLQSRIRTLLDKPRNLPIPDPNSTTPVKLARFPSNDIIKLGKSVTGKVHAESDKMYEQAVDLNRRSLLLPGTLPIAANQPLALSFRRVLLDALVKLRTDYLQAGNPPTEQEMANRAGVIWDALEKQIVKVNDKPTNLEQIMAQYNDQLAKLPKIMMEEMATRYKMYVDPTRVMLVPASLPADGNSPNPMQIWWAQVNYWITSDVAAAIHDLNANSASVMDSPLKNLIALNIPEDFFPPVGTAQAPAADDPAAATPATGGIPDATLPIPDASGVSPTRRTSNNLYDVVQFKMTVDIEADKIALFLKTLATNRFITVTRVEMNPVDSQLKQTQKYVYGPRPVVTLDLDCEALLMRQWTHKLMPVALRKALGIPDQPKPGAPALPVGR